ncbi:hypothetical protein NL676_024738 [Syzygium grande]|nr:hypothetical protein NL676_024738 [Syzygium grande]
MTVDPKPNDPVPNSQKGIQRVGSHFRAKRILRRSKRNESVGASRVAMAVVVDDTTRTCSHCERSIPSPNIDLHYAHCSRNLEKCKVCGDMVPKRHAEEHFLTTHAPGTEMMERDILAVHRGENCPQRIVTCEFCEFPLPAIDLAEHQEVCGNRTELCHLCNRYIRLRERYNHERRCEGVPDHSAGPSSNIRPPQGERPPRGQPNEYSPRRILFTIAITGIAVLLGSLFFQKKLENNQVH